MGKSKELATGAVYVDASGDTMTGNLGIGDGNPTNHYGEEFRLVLREDQTSPTQMCITNATVGANAKTQYKMIGGTGNSFAGWVLDDNNGSPYSDLSFGSAVNHLQIGLGGQERMRIDSAGRVTMPYQLHIEGTPNRSGSGIANAFYTRNTPVGLSFSNERITVPIAGRYLVCWNTIADNGSGRVDTYIYINGTTVVNSMGESYNNAYRFRGSAHVFNLAANDYIQFYHQDFYNSGLSSHEVWNNASVTLLG